MDITEALRAYERGDLGGAMERLRRAAGGEQVADVLEKVGRDLGLLPGEARYKRVGVFGGGFNPIHHAHLIFAQEAMEVAGLDKVILVPSANPSDREINVPFHHRYAMCQAAVYKDKRFEVSDIEEHLDLSFTRDTIAQLKLRGHEHDDFYLLLGGDRAASFFEWEGVKGLVENLAGMVCVARESHSRRAIVTGWVDGTEKHSLADDTFMPTILKMPPNNLSATYIRNRIEAGRSVRYMVPDAVREYIEAEGLYSE